MNSLKLILEKMIQCCEGFLITLSNVTSHLQIGTVSNRGHLFERSARGSWPVFSLFLGQVLILRLNKPD
jgi:hypothetical protein